MFKNNFIFIFLKMIAGTTTLGFCLTLTFFILFINSYLIYIERDNIILSYGCMVLSVVVTIGGIMGVSWKIYKCYKKSRLGNVIYFILAESVLILHSIATFFVHFGYAKDINVALMVINAIITIKMCVISIYMFAVDNI